ncbi:hypothetical protein [Vibrio coralliilyticus]|uniref:hypothetical protein n=1 Tax=Vibrio coralliilyticus TaxID=190893 RepID=UPI0020A4E4FB|nr:hypothetical protein [Vibrio coralliilyticus]
MASMVDALMAAQVIAMLDEFAFARLSIAERQHLPKRTRCFIDFCRQALTHHHGSATLF